MYMYNILYQIKLQRRLLPIHSEFDLENAQRASRNQISVRLLYALTANGNGISWR